MRESSADAPRPKLQHSYTTDVSDLGGRLGSAGGRRSLLSVGESSDTLVPKAEPTMKKARRSAKERNTSLHDRRGSQATNDGKKAAQLLRSQTTSVDLKIAQRSNYRSAQGLDALKEQMGFASQTRSRDSDDEAQPASSPKSALAPAPRRRVAAGFYCGDVVHSLVSRLRAGTRVLELGHEGMVVCAARASAASEEAVRLLVQFRAGHDWYLPALQLSTTASFSAARAAGLPGGFAWGARVQSLVTYLKPLGAKKEVWLGDAGTVVGPGLATGKLAVRFDDDRGEWSMWPSTVCLAENYEGLVLRKLPGDFCRGDRVRAVSSCRGMRGGGGSAAPSGLLEGDEGTVVGPGHSGRHVLVHFDSDERVWSLLPEQVDPLDGRDVSCV